MESACTKHAIFYELNKLMIIIKRVIFNPINFIAISFIIFFNNYNYSVVN